MPTWTALLMQSARNVLCGSGGLAIGKGFFQLADNLVLAYDHRFDAGGKREEVVERLPAFEQEKTLPPVLFKELPERTGITFDNHLYPVAGLEEENTVEFFLCSGKERRLVPEPEGFECHHVRGMVADTGNGDP